MNERSKINTSRTNTENNTNININKRSILTLSDKAANRIKELMKERENDKSKSTQCLGIRIGVKSGGCSGMRYIFEYVEEQKSSDIIVQDKDVTLFIDIKAELFIIGTELDYIDEEIKSGFVFINPNAKGQCGCGESFNV